MSLWNDLLSGLGHFGQTLGNDLGAAGNAVGSFVRNDVGPSLFRASDFARNSASTIGQDLINGSSPLYRDVFEPIFDPLTNAAGHISSDITGNDAFGNRVDQQSLYDQAHSDNGLITDALSAPSNFLAKGILQPSFHAGTNLGLGLDYLRAGHPTESISPFVEGAMGAGNALFHAANPLLASGMDVAGGLTHGTLNGQGIAGTAEDALSNMGGANGYDLGHEVTSKLPESFQQQHPLLTGGLAMGLDIGAMRGIENPEGALSDLGQSLLNPKAGIENELSRLPLLNRYFHSFDAQNAGANSLLTNARLALLSGSPEEAAATAEQMGHQAAATDAERFNQDMSQNPNIADHSNMMMGVTNMDPEKFGSAVSQDAVIAPSIAGINATHDFSQFGGMNGEPAVQLIHSPENLDPGAENVFAYGHDAYTPTVPQPQYAGQLNMTDKLMGDLLENHVAAHTLSPDTQPHELQDLLNSADVPRSTQQKLLSEAYGEPVVSFTDAQGNQKILPYTKENIKTAMLSKVEANGGDARATQTGVGIAPPQTFGAKQFQSMDEMKQHIGNLKPMQELENDPSGRKAIQDAYDYLSKVADKAGKNLPNYHPFDSSLVKNQFISQLLMKGDTATPETVAEAMGNLNIPNKEKVLQHMDFNQLNKLLDQFRNPVTDYHEIKNFNLVDWDKIPGIVIPSYDQMQSVYGMSQEQIQALKSNVDQLVEKHPDVKVVQYDATDPEGQAKARIANFPQAMFGSLIGFQPETDKNGKPTGKVKFNLGSALVGAMGMAMAGHVREVGEPTSLMVTHNLSEEGLAKADSLGGLARPSLGIVDPEKHTIDNFGEVTLVGNNKLVTPRSNGARVYSADAYSPRQPRAELQLNNPIAAMKDRFGQWYDAMGRSPYSHVDQNRPLDGMTHDPAVIAEYLHQKGLLPSDFNFKDNFRDLADIVHTNKLHDDFHSWAENELKSMGAEPMLHAGFTPSGKPKWIPESMDNIQKLMSKEAKTGGDIIPGLASTRAAVTPEFKSISDILKSKDRLMSSSDFEKVKEQMSQNHDALIEELGKYATSKNENRYMQYDRQATAIADYLRGDKSALKYGFDNTPDEFLKKLDQFKQDLQKMPTEYFEAKVGRPVHLSEFETALVPHTASQRTLDILQRNGLKVVKYGDEGRAAALKALRDEDNASRGFSGQQAADVAKKGLPLFGGLAGVQTTQGKDGKDHVSFNPGAAALGAAGMAIAGHLTNPGEEAGAMKNLEEGQQAAIPHKPLDIIKPLPQTITPSERLLQQIAQEKQAIENDHLDYLNATGKQGVTPGGLIRNEDGEVTGRFGAVSNNDPWYQEFYKANGRPPSQAELKQIALDHLTNGFTSASGEVPPHEEYNSLLRMEQAVKQDQGSGQPEEPLQVRQFSNTVRTADNALSPETRGQVGDYYNVVHNQDAINAAKDRIAQSVEEAHNFATGDTPPSAEKTATGLGLMQHYDQTGQTDKAVEVAQKMAEDATSQGQAIQALSIINKLSPEGILIYAQRQLNKVNELLPDGKKINLSTEEADQLKTMADTISKMPDGHQKDIATAQMLTKVADKTPKSIGRKLSSLQSMALLLNPKTILMKIGLGHTAFGAFDTAVTKGVGSLVDRGVSLLTGQRTTAAPDVPQLLKNYASGIGEKIQEANAGVNIRQSTPFEEGMKVGGHTFSSAPMQKLEDISNAVIGSVPAGVNKAVYEDSLRGQMKLANTTEVTDEMKQRATLDAQYATFMDKSALSEALTHIKQGMNKVGISGFGAGEGILKFAHVPANIISSSIDYSPVGFVKTLYQLGRDAMQGQGFDQAQFVRNISRAGVGSATMLGVNAALARLGIINGKLNDAKQAVRYEQSQGQRDYQLNASALYRYLTSGFNPDAAKPQTGDKMVTYNWMEPLGTNMAAGAEYAKTQAKDLPTALLHSTVDAVQAASETPMFKGLQTLLSTNDPNTGQPSLVAGAEKVATGMPASFVPTVVNNIRNLTDNTVRNTYPANNAPWYQEMLNQVEDKIPLLSNHLAPRVDVSGNVMQKYPEGNTVLNAFFNPSNSSRLQNNPVANELIRLYQQNNTTSQFPGAVYNSVKSNGTQVNIDPQTQAQMQHWMGQMAQISLQELMSTSQYQQANDTQRASLVAGQLNAIDSAAKEKFLGITPTRSTTSQASTGRPHRPSRPSRHTRVSKRDQLMSQPQPSQLPLLSQ